MGEIPSGMDVLHPCDNPACCDPAHLFLGTQQDNIDDMVAKGRNRPHPFQPGNQEWRKRLAAAPLG